uniref:BY PROTMAP: gi/647396917/emb/CDR39616.1/ RHTO0S04e07074g1_1 [Rhodosporidium toruloides] n=1 Tax=Rhodotorula toruloides TaxID=5286 RepID=A0A0K3C6D9_RHOTO
MGKLAKVSIERNGGLFIMAPPCGHVEMFFRLFQPFLGKGGHVVLFFRVRRETSGSLDFAFFDQERGLSTGDAGFFQIVTKAGYFYSGFYTPGGWCTKFWSDDDPPKNMTFGNLSLGSRPLKAASEAIRQQVDEELEEVTGHVKQWACTTLFPTPSVLQYVRGKEASARC